MSNHVESSISSVFLLVSANACNQSIQIMQVPKTCTKQGSSVFSFSICAKRAKAGEISETVCSYVLYNKINGLGFNTNAAEDEPESASTLKEN